MTPLFIDGFEEIVSCKKRNEILPNDLLDAENKRISEEFEND